MSEYTIIGFKGKIVYVVKHWYEAMEPEAIDAVCETEELAKAYCEYHTKRIGYNYEYEPCPLVTNYDEIPHA